MGGGSSTGRKGLRRPAAAPVHDGTAVRVVTTITCSVGSSRRSASPPRMPGGDALLRELPTEHVIVGTTRTAVPSCTGAAAGRRKPFLPVELPPPIDARRPRKPVPPRSHP